MITVSETKLEGVLHISPDVFKDHRGQYVEVYNKELYKKKGISVDFVQDDIALSKKDVLRGMHGDQKTHKLVSCPYGTLFFVVANCNEQSPHFGTWQSFILSGENRHQIFIPSGYGIGYLVQSNEALFSYKQSTYYIPGVQFTYVWNDARFSIEWPITNPILSKRDTNA